MTDDFRLFAPFTKIAKQADGSIRAHSVIHDEALDDQGEVIDYAGGKAAIDEFMKWANVREMHGEVAVGVVESVLHNDADRVSEGVLHIVDPVAVQKVETGVYKGTSWGGLKGTKRALEKVGGHTATRLLDPTFIELSLVDRPSRPTAVLTLLKRADPVTEGDDMSKAAAAPAADVSREKPATAPALVVVNNSAPGSEALAKAAADDLVSAHMIEEQIARLIEAESGEDNADTAQVGKLKAALASMQEFDALESGELGSTDDTAEAAAEEAEFEAELDAAPVATGATVILAAAASTRDLRKAGARNNAADQAALDQIVALAIALGGNVPPPPDDAAAAPAAAAPVAPPPTDPIAKVAGAEFVDAVMDRLAKSATYVGMDALNAMKAELLGALAPIKEELAKVAAQPAPGGPLRYATDPRGLHGQTAEQPSEAAVQAVLAKVSDPRLREELGHAIAAEEIAGLVR